MLRGDDHAGIANGCGRHAEGDGNQVDPAAHDALLWRIARDKCRHERWHDRRRRRARGAASATIKILTPAKFAAKGTLFDATGTLRYTLNGTLTSGSDGSLHLSGTGTFTGGTGNYRGAHGSFTGSGTKPAGSFQTFTFRDKVSYW